jgi:hypothetical protein
VYEESFTVSCLRQSVMNCSTLKVSKAHLNAEVKNERNYTSTPPCIFRAGAMTTFTYKKNLVLRTLNDIRLRYENLCVPYSTMFDPEVGNDFMFLCNEWLFNLLTILQPTGKC